ncbi:MAG: glycosyltransferase family 2 protein [Chloroherpetonaceae bacterium]|nr:glycosyltransferase family 2 protein [Chloroherpetonaceae bacterium]
MSAGRNLGYAGGCNFGFRHTEGKYVIFLNNDTEQEPDWIEHLVEVAESDERIAALQPKLRSMQAKLRGEKVFDYAGAAGGMLDMLGYPYALGRVFNAVEPDHGQYDESRDIFWASGAAMMVRRKAIEQVGAFDDDFFAHMEEIDLCWRLKIAGYRIVSVPKAVVYHYGGATLAAGNPRKIYLNHRNNLMMIIKNASWSRLLWLLPVRVLLELAALIYYQRYASEYVRYVWRALWWNVQHFIKNIAKRSSRAKNAHTKRP